MVSTGSWMKKNAYIGFLCTILNSHFPQNFRVLITLNKDTPQFRAMQSRKCHMFNIEPLSTTLSIKLLKDNTTQAFMTDVFPHIKANEKLLSNPYMLRIIMDLHSNIATETATVNAALKLFESIATFEEFIEKYLVILPKQFMSGTLFQKICMMISLSECGCSLEQINASYEVNHSSVESVLKLLSFGTIMVDKEYYLFVHPLKEVILKKYCSDSMTLSEERSHILKTVMFSKSIKLNSYLYLDLVGHCSNSKRWGYLKDSIIELNNFLYLYKPELRYFFIQIWKEMIKRGYDPVTEYNTVSELYYQNCTSNQKLHFLILIQLSRFFYELKDIEDKHTSEFRHPPLKATDTCSGELLKINLYRLFSHPMLPGLITDQYCIQLKDEENINLKNPKNKDLIYSKIKDEIEYTKAHPLMLKPKEHYYFKRWLWIQFPWLCIELSYNFSRLMLHLIEWPYPSSNYIGYSTEIELNNKIVKHLLLLKDDRKGEVQNISKFINESIDIDLDDSDDKIMEMREKNNANKRKVPSNGSQTSLPRKLRSGLSNNYTLSLLNADKGDDNIEFNVASFKEDRGCLSSRTRSPLRNPNNLDRFNVLETIRETCNDASNDLVGQLRARKFYYEQQLNKITDQKYYVN